MGDLNTPFKSASALERRVENQCYIKPELSKTADVSQGSKFPSFYSLIQFLDPESYASPDIPGEITLDKLRP